MIRPNSLDNDKWYQIQKKIQLAKYMLLNNNYNNLEEEENDDILDYSKYKKFNYPQNNSFNSKKSEKSSNKSNEKKKEIKEPEMDDLKKNQESKKDNAKKDKNDNKINSINVDDKKNKINISNEEPIKNKNNIIKNDDNKGKLNNNIINKNEVNINNIIIKENENIVSDNNKENINKEKIEIDKNKEKKIVNNKNENLKNQTNKEENITITKKVKEERVEKDKKKEKEDEKDKKSQNDKKIKEERVEKEDEKDIKKEKEINKKEDVKGKKIGNDKTNKEEIVEKENGKKKEKDKRIEKDEKIIDVEFEIKPNHQEKQNNIKKDNQNINAPKKEKKIIEQNELNEKQQKNNTASEIDISAEKDEVNSIEWEYSLNNSKHKSQDSNSQNLRYEQSKEENIIDNYNINIKEENSPNKIKEEKDKIIEENTEIPNVENGKMIKKFGLIDDDEKSQESEEREIEKEKKDIKVDSKKHNKTLKKDKKTLNESEDEYLDDFEDIDLDLNSESETDRINKSNKQQKEKDKDKEKENIIDNNKDKNDKSRNINLEKNKKEIQIEEEKIITKPSSSIQPSKDILIKIKDQEKFSKDLTEEILKKILESEIISNKIKLIPHKSFKYEFFTNFNSSQSNLSASGGSAGNNFNKELGLLGQLSLNDDLSSLNDSIMSSYSAFSVFNRTIKDKKKEHSLNLYYKKIAPRLIKLIKEEIYLKYPRIYENISMPLKNQSIGLMMSLSLQDADMLRDNYKCVLMKESIKNIIDKEKILKKFEPINKQIRSKDNLTSDNFYDNILNECLIDTAIELINKERLYGENGDPLAWSSRTHELVYKYKKNDPEKLAKYVCNNILKTLHTRIGLLTENYDYLNAEQINNERDKRLIDNIRNELDEDEYQWRNLEMEETQLKVEIAELIMDQLYNENIEILEHIQFSRNRPDLYQNKSIYACEEIPKLSFQQTTTENAL